MVVSDNAANMIKAIKILAENAEIAKSEETSKTEDDYEEAVSDDGETEDELEQSSEDAATSDDEAFEPETVHYKRMVCMAHSLQLVIKEVYRVVQKTRKKSIKMY